MYVRLFFWIGLLYFCSNIYAQNQQIAVTSVSQQLSQSSVTAILNDNQGYLWVGTRYGLNKYLGHRFEIFVHEPGDSSSIYNSNITALAKDSKGNIWIGTSGGGLSKYDVLKNQFSTFVFNEKEVQHIGGNKVTCLFIDENDQVFIGLEKNGLSIFNPGSHTFRNFAHDSSESNSLSHNYVTSIDKDNRGTLWVGTWGAGIDIFHEESEKFEHFDLANSIGFNQANTIRSMCSTDTEFFIGTDWGVALASFDEDTDSYKIKPGLPGVLKDIVPVLAIAKDSKKNIWVGTENDGIYIKEFSSGKVNNILKNNSVWSIYEDQVGTVWMGIHKDGLYKVDPFENRFSHEKHEPNKSNSLSYDIVSSFSEDKSGNIWIGTDGGGINCFNIKTGVFEPLQFEAASDAILDLLLDKNENLWIATWEGGVSLWSEKANDVQHLDRTNGLLGDNIYDLLEDEKGQIWISSFREGINIYDPISSKFSYLTYEHLGVDKVRTMIQDVRGHVWLGTEGEGLIKLVLDEKNNIESKIHLKNDSQPKNSLGRDIITMLYESNDTTIWIGTEGGGLVRMHSKSYEVQRFTTKDGLPSNVIYGILEDDHNNLWLSTGNGLSQFNPFNFESSNYDVSDGIQSPEFFKGACFKTSTGKFFFGGINGFNHFYPSEIELNPYPPNVHLNSISVNGEVMRLERTSNGLVHMLLEHNQNDIEISYSALNYSQPLKNTFKYRMEGVDENWITSEGIYQVNYANLSTGEYQFKLKAANNDGEWNTEGVSLYIQIKNPWWNTPWAYLIYSLLLIGLAYLVFRIRSHRERLKNKLKIEHLEVVKMQELDELKNRFFTNISHEFKTPLTLIMDPLTNLFENSESEHLKSQYRVVIRNAKRLLDLVNQLLDISRLEAKMVKLQASYGDIMETISPIAFSFCSYSEKHFVNFKCNFPDNTVMMYFEKERIEKVVSNLLSNAFKYTPEYGEVIFEIKIEDQRIVMEVKDDGIGIPKHEQDHIFNRFYRVQNSTKSGTGVGLALTKEIVELHKGQISVTSNADEGAIFKVTIPMGKDHLASNEILELDHGQANLIKEEKEEINLAFNNTREKANTADKSSDALPLLLVVEDNFEMRSYICTYLENKYKLIEAENGAKGKELALQMIPDLIISDVSIPNINGYDLCEYLKTDERTSHIPFIMLTGKSSEKNIQEGFSKGADYYITKPFNSMLLELRITNILNAKKSMRKRILEEHTTEVQPTEDTMSPKDKSFVDKVVGCIETNMSDSTFHIDDLCKSIGMSRMQLYRKLKGIVGLSANEFIRTIRLRKAAQLLKTNSLTVAEVTYKVGFSDLHYFRFAFKKQFGVNPSDFKDHTN